MGKVLALDYGEKRIGVAISDELKIIAKPLLVLSGENWEEGIKDIQKKEAIEKVIIGLPRTMDGSLGSLVGKVNEFKAELEKIVDAGVAIEFEDESVSSLEAEKRLKDRGVDLRKNKEEIDKEAAVIILESYFRRDNA